MGQLSKAASANVAEAQYLLGSLLLDDEDDNDDEDDQEAEDDLLGDAETHRQQANQDDEPKDLRAIRKQARKAYKEYLQQSTASDRQKLAASTPRLVQRATVSELDRAFGTTLAQLLDPKFKVPALSETATMADKTQAVEWIRRAADNTHREAHVHLGNLCLAQDPPLAQQACEWYARVTSARDPAPHPDALYNLGLMLYDGVDDAEPPFPSSKPASIAYFVRAAEAGDGSAQFFMGHLLHQGNEELGIEANMESAMMLINTAADNGHPGAQYYLAQLYRSGDEANGIEADREKFLSYLDSAMDGEDEDALFCMADIYFHGSDGFEQDYEQARRFYLAAAEADHADAFCCLGAMYYNGIGVAQDYTKAFLYYQEAAERDSMEAWKNLAEMYSVGRGVPRNEATAQSIFKMLRKADAQAEE